MILRFPPLARALLAVLVFLSLDAGAAPLEFVQRPDAQLPLAAAFQDENGRPVRLGDYFGGAPVVLVLGYYRCPNLCSTLMDGVLESLVQSGLPADAYRLVAVSIDPREDVEAARARLAAYRPLLPPGAAAHFLTGKGDAAARLAASVGFPYAWDAGLGQYAHPAGFVVATPGGRIARYFLGVRWTPRELRFALTEAARGRSGALAERLLLLCSHYDPRSGRYDGAVMSVVRVVCSLLAVALALWVRRRRRVP